MSAPLAEVVEEGQRLAKAATSRNWDNAGFPAPLPWRATANPVPMVWADDGDAVVMQMPNGEPYFEQPVAEFIAFAASNLDRLLAVASAADRLEDYVCHAPICTWAINTERKCDCGMVEALAAYRAAVRGES